MRAFCSRCKHTQEFVRIRPNHAFHLILSALTFGLWLVSYVSVCLGAKFRPWRCKHCGWHHPTTKNPIAPDAELNPAPPSSTVFRPPTKPRRYDEPDTPQDPLSLGSTSGG